MTPLSEDQLSDDKADSDKNAPLIGKGPKSAHSGFSAATTEVAFSNYQYPIEDDKEPGAVFLRIRGKPGVTKKNLILIPGLTLMLAFTITDVMQTSS